MLLIFKKKTLNLVLIFLLLIFLAYTEQGSIYYKSSVILIFILNFLLVDLRKIKNFVKKFFKIDYNMIFIVIISIFFLRNFYSLQIFISAILAFFLFTNFKNLEKKFKIKLIYFFSIFSIVNYYILGFILTAHSKKSYILDYNIIAKLNDYNLFVGINFHNLSVLFLAILFLKFMYFRSCLKEFRNIYIISIVHDFLFVLNLGYISVFIFSFLILIAFYFLSAVKKIRYKILFFFVILISLNFILLPSLTNKIIELNLITSFEKINYVLEFIKLKTSEFNKSGEMVGLQEIKSTLGNEFIPLLGFINRIIFYWSPINYELSIFGFNNYNDFNYHSLFLEFLSNYGLIGLFVLYFYLYKFYSIIDTKYSKLFFLIIVCLNTMDTFLFNHHYQLMMMSWIFIGLLDEKKNL